MRVKPPLDRAEDSKLAALEAEIRGINDAISALQRRKVGLLARYRAMLRKMPLPGP